MSMAYIRQTYGVPAKRGGRVEYTATDGAKFRGTIVGANGAYLRVRMDGFKCPLTLHPTWSLQYLEGEEAK